jgi:hypothetical protein
MDGMGWKEISMIDHERANNTTTNKVSYIVNSINKFNYLLSLSHRDLACSPSIGTASISPLSTPSFSEYATCYIKSRTAAPS